MTTDQLRKIFGRFENLNLLFLIEDLRRDLVATDFWNDREEGNLCPLAHGWSSRCEFGVIGFDEKAPFLLAGITRELGSIFTSEWDDGLINNGQLLRTLEALYAERLADADAVQAVCAPVLEEALA